MSKHFRPLDIMRFVPDWWIQISWWASGIFATGGVWYFLSTHEYFFAIAAGIAAVIFAVVAIILHMKQDALKAPSHAQAPVEKDKLVTSQWWETSAPRRKYIGRGLTVFHWSNAGRVAECQQAGYEVVYLEDSVANTRFRIVNKSGQILIAKIGNA